MGLTLPLMTPEICVLLLVDPQPGLAFAVQSIDRQMLVNNLRALAETALAFDLPIVVSTSATRVYSGPVMAAVREVIGDSAVLERRNMNAWEDEAVRSAVQATRRKTLLVAGLLTEACVAFPVLCAAADGYTVYVVADACGGASALGHQYALSRMRDGGAQVTSWLQVLLELQRDWTRRSTYDAARGVVERYGGGYGIGLSYARDMIAPPVAQP
jgi:nicotinamidase-related amidase